MSGLGKAIKNNILKPHDKYSMAKEKVAEVLSFDSRNDCCNILYINTDGIPIIAEDVPIKKTSGLFAGSPKVGDIVEIKEQGKSVVITGESLMTKEVADDSAVKMDYYSDSLSGTAAGYIT